MVHLMYSLFLYLVADTRRDDDDDHLHYKYHQKYFFIPMFDALIKQGGKHSMNDEQLIERIAKKFKVKVISFVQLNQLICIDLSQISCRFIKFFHL